MPTYIMLVNFTDQGLKGVKEVPNRQDKSRETAKQFGVERKTVWMTFGPYDFVHVYEAPNDEAMAKFVMTLASFGNVRTTVMRAWDEFRASSAHTRAFMTCPLNQPRDGKVRSYPARRRCLRLRVLLAHSRLGLPHCICLLSGAKQT